ncbi:hypothetical protein FQP90_01760 [Paenarthrobacter nitroguajacolicus]|uniref:ESX secretion-associated protein EspG n=1 Tax=Paenarthrobacter nitroguajacolicus TaxID=211146 RepID=A0A558HCN3_PAENT|nr:hypothetical protein [Paenarthrobacter nitroguajacolicus]TVU66890.1 hypothetical protein FQP90_01760 [Paenarthrobacter nitroguajacolicus]
MGAPRADAALNILEVSGLAWAETVRRAMESMPFEPDADVSRLWASAQVRIGRELDGVDHRDVRAELRRAGIVDSQGVLVPQWILAVGIAATAPVKAATVVQWPDQSIHTETGLAGGRGVGVTYRRRIRHQPDGSAVTEVRNAVEVSFFQEEDAWAALSRHFPDLSEHRTVPHDAVATGTTIHLEVSASQAGPGWNGHPFASRHMWSMTDRLYSVGTDPADGNTPTLTAVPGTDIGREFAWRLLGAREYLASAADGKARA